MIFKTQMSGSALLPDAWTAPYRTVGAICKLILQ